MLITETSLCAGLIAVEHTTLFPHKWIPKGIDFLERLQALLKSSELDMYSEAEVVIL